MNKNTVIFNYSALADNLELQAKSQGYTLGSYVDMLEQIRHSINMCGFHVATESQVSSMFKKLNDKVLSSLKELETKKVNLINIREVEHVYKNIDVYLKDFKGSKKIMVIYEPNTESHRLANSLRSLNILNEVVEYINLKNPSEFLRFYFSLSNNLNIYYSSVTGGELKKYIEKYKYLKVLKKKYSLTIQKNSSYYTYKQNYYASFEELSNAIINDYCKYNNIFHRGLHKETAVLRSVHCHVLQEIYNRVENKKIKKKVSEC